MTDQAQLPGTPDQIRQNKAKYRQPTLTVAVGQKGIGKTYLTMEILKGYVVGNPAAGIKPRKVVLFDVNNEFPEYKTINIDCAFDNTKPNWMLVFSSARTPPQIRRISMKHKDGTSFNVTEINQALKYVLQNFYGGCLLVEDINKYVADMPKNDISGALATQRHQNCDVIVHYQYKSKAGNPKIFGFLRYVRIHKTTDTFMTLKDKFKGVYGILQVCEFLERMKNKQLLERATPEQLAAIDDIPVETFYCIADVDRNKIMGRYTKNELREAVKKYVLMNKGEIQELINDIDLDTGENKYTKAEAIRMRVDELTSAYWPGT